MARLVREPVIRTAPISINNLKEESPFTDKERTELGLPVNGRHYSKPNRPFIAWDGEGISPPAERIKIGFFEMVCPKPQNYVLFGASAGERITSPSLGTRECFEILLSVERNNPDGIHIIFGAQYDFNMMLKDLPYAALWQIYNTNKVVWNGYRIEYLPRKWLYVARGNTSAKIFDVWTFFQASFVTAIERYVGTDSSDYQRVLEGKRRRKDFTYSQIQSYVIPYWESELRLLVQLMESLRSDLRTAGFTLSSWHGPGAIANVVLKKFNIHLKKKECPKEVNRAAQYAYSGGRFELFKAGWYKGPIYRYDKRSAYPSYISKLPDLSTGIWEATTEFDPKSFGVWRIDYRNEARRPKASPGIFTHFFAPNPLFYRNKHGNVSFPSMVKGWYWTPEARMVDASSIREGWVYKHSGDLPFSWVDDYYQTRQQWKEEGNSAERTLKLILNSLYGKMAQRLGWKEEEENEIPLWHQLEWAGYVTSATRASLWDLIKQSPENIISTETDAVFSTVPLDVKIGTNLGEWEETRFDSILYLQNGLYWAFGNDNDVFHYRGYDKDSLSFDATIDWLHALERGENVELSGVTTRFIGMGLALHTSAVWRSWVTESRAIHFGGGGKRAHMKTFCPTCRQAKRFVANAWHPLAIRTAGGTSEPHSLPWLESQESELRKQDDLAQW